MLKFGDYVKCCNCGASGLVAVGESVCPKCGTEGALAWAKDDQEVYEASADFVGRDLLERLEEFGAVNDRGEISDQFLHFQSGTKVDEIRQYIKTKYGVLV